MDYLILYKKTNDYIVIKYLIIIFKINKIINNN